MRFWAAPRLFLTVPGGQQQPGVADLVRRARIYAGHLFDQMERMGLTFGWQSWEQLDGSRVTVYCHGDFDTGFVQARIDVAGGSAESVEVILAYIEHGLLVWNPYDPEYPLPVYTDDALRAYMESDGTEITDTRLDHVWGHATTLSDEACSSGTSGVQWSDPLPTMGVDGEYPSGLWLSASPASQLQIWTGIARGAAQNRASMSGLLPSGWSGDPRETGIVRSPDGEYWICRAGAGGVQMAHLTLSPYWHCLRERLQSGALTGLDSRAVEGMLLIALTLASGTEVVEVVTATQAAALYGSGAGPLAHGVHWYWQNARGDAAGWVVVTNYATGTGDTFVLHARRGLCNITWTDGSPSATLDVRAAQDWAVGTLRIAAPGSQEGALYAPWSATLTPAHGPADVYAWTTVDGVSYLQHGTPHASGWGADTRPGAWGTWPIYTGGSGTKDNTNSGAGGWEVHGAQSADATMPILTEHYSLERSLSPEGGASVTMTDDIPGKNVRLRWFYPEAASQSCVIAEGSSVTINAHDMKAREAGEHKYSGSGNWGAAILGTDTGVALFRLQAWGYQDIWSGEAVVYNRPESSSASCGSRTSYYCVPPPGGANAGITAVHEPGTLDTVGYSNAGYQTPSVVHAYPGAGYEYQCWLCGSDGAVLYLDGAEWTALGASTGEAAVPYLSASWGGAVIYSPEFDARTGPAGLDSTAIDATYSAWRGGI